MTNTAINLVITIIPTTSHSLHGKLLCQTGSLLHLSLKKLIDTSSLFFYLPQPPPPCPISALWGMDTYSSILEVHQYFAGGQIAVPSRRNFDGVMWNRNWSPNETLDGRPCGPSVTSVPFQNEDILSKTFFKKLRWEAFLIMHGSP